MKPTTKDYSAELRKLADFLDVRPEFKVELGIYIGLAPVRASVSFYDKSNFIAAAKVFGSATKKYTEGEFGKFELTSTEFPLTLSISRDKVCTKKVIYDCEPIFSAEEVEAL